MVTENAVEVRPQLTVPVQFTHLYAHLRRFCFFFPQTLKREFEQRRFVWELQEQVERPRVVGAKLVPLESKDNYFGQVVVRTHTSQVSQFSDVLVGSSLIIQV